MLANMKIKNAREMAEKITRYMTLCSISDGLEIPEINYLGYSMIEGQVGIDLELISRSGKSVRIREIPEFDSKDNYSGINRSFNILGGDSKDLIVLLNYNLIEGVVNLEMINGVVN